MMLRCLSKFDIESEETGEDFQPEATLNQDERTEGDEVREAGLPECIPEAISEGEDGDNSDEAGEIVTDQEAAEESDDDSALHPLPAIDTISQARPQRDRKRRRDEDLYEYTR